MSSRSAKSGYAVLELLISIAILGLLTAAISSSLSQGRRVWEKAESISENSKRHAEINFLLRHLSQAQPVSASHLSTISPGTLFAGTHNHLTFVSFWRFESTNHEIPARLELTAGSENTDTPTIVVSPLKNQSDANRPLPVQETRKLNKISRIAFRYFGKRSGEEGANWSDNWGSQAHLPTLIELTVTPIDRKKPSDTQSYFIRPRLK